MKTLVDIYEFDSSRGGRWLRVYETLRDLRAGAAMWSIWWRLGWMDFLRSTRRTTLGPIWTIVSTAITVGALGYLYGSVLGMTQGETFPYLAAGFVLWFFISSTVTGGFSVYESARGILQERSLPISFTVFRYVFRLVVEIVFKFSVFFIAAAMVSLPFGPVTLWAIPGLILFILNGIWAVLMFGVIGARFRDVQQFVNPLMFLAFLASPVLWHQGMLARQHEFIADFNPFAHFLAIVREPLLGRVPSMMSIWVVLGITVVGWAVAVWVFSRTKDRIVYWL